MENYSSHPCWIPFLYKFLNLRLKEVSIKLNVFVVLDIYEMEIVMLELKQTGPQMLNDFAFV